MNQNMDIPHPTRREVSVWSQERNLRVLRVVRFFSSNHSNVFELQTRNKHQVRAREHPLYAAFFDFLDRKVPIHGVYSRMDKSLDKSVLNTPEKLIPV